MPVLFALCCLKRHLVEGFSMVLAKCPNWPHALHSRRVAVVRRWDCSFLFFAGRPAALLVCSGETKDSSAGCETSCCCHSWNISYCGGLLSNHSLSNPHSASVRSRAFTCEQLMPVSSWFLHGHSHRCRSTATKTTTYQVKEAVTLTEAFTS